MDSVRVSPSFSPTPSLNDVTPSMGMSLKNNHIALQQRMPDPSNLNVLNQHLVQQPMSSGGSRIFISTQIETRDELDEKHDRCYNIVMGLISGKSAKEAIDSLTTAVGKDTRAHDDVCIGLIIGTLTSSPQAEGDASATRFLRDLTLICRDGLTHVLSHLSHLVLEKYSKLMPLAKQQLLWIIRELVRSSVAGMDSVVWNLMRQIAGGDVSRNNLWLADSLLDLFTDHRSWLDKFSFLVASVAYTYLRLIEDHAAPQLEKLREKEVKFVVPLIRDRFADVMVIGRDLVRVLQYVAKLPEMSDLWRDLLFNPKNVAPGYTGLSQLMETRTSRRFLQSRITPEMEKKLVFLTSQVKFGSHKRYQDWFQRQYLSTPESQSLRCDLIRFIVGVIHPTNELLCSDIIPRWAVIGWLLTTCTSQVAASNAKLALFYDWLFFEPDKDNIMNIEPAILVMHHSIKPHPAITATLLDFLCRIITNFYPKEQDKVRNGIYSSLRQILEKRVLPSLSPLFDNPRLDRELKFLLRERFAPFVDCTKPIDRPSDGLAILDDPVDSETVLEPVEDMTGGPEFSDDEIEEVKGNGEGLDNIDGELVGYDSKKAKKKPSAPSRKDPSDSKSSPVKVRKRPVKQNVAGVDTESTILDQNVRRLLVELRSGAGPVADDNLPLRTEEDEEKCEIMDQLIRVIISEDFSYEQCNALALRLSDILRPTFEGKVFPAARDVETLEDSVGKPLFVAFRALCDLADGEGSGILLQVLAELYALQPRVGYYLLYFLSVDKQAKQREPRPKATIYKDLCETIDSNYSLDICLVNDMRQCQEDDVELFVHLVPDVYTIFPKSSIGNVNLLYLVVSCVDGRQIQRLVCHILSKELLLFKKDSFASIVTSSLTWETFEQYAFWQLISAHDVPVDCMVSVLPKLKFENHPEALTATLLRLRSERPSADLMRHVLSRDPSVGDRFVSTCLGYWLFEHEDKLVDLISSYLLKQANSGSSSNSSGSGSSSLKRKRGGATSSSSLPRKAEMALMHLDVLRQNCKQTDFFSHPNLQKALRLSRQLCTDAQKKKFMDLFALAETESDGDEDDDEEVQFTHKPSSSSRKNSATKSSKSNSRGNKRTVQDDDVVSESSESDNSDEEDSKPLSSSGSRSKHRGGGGKATKAVSNPRKRAPSKVSYKEMESSDDSSEDESSSKRKKRRKKIANSDSD